ncbi:MAG TPA: adenosine deaminase, partial [Bdellovibrionota bacterium]|nr:adenosine deaminase [Bdellovibrionota bacterium]
AISDPSLMKTLHDQGICLEVCPTSNVLTRCAASYGEHPLPRLVRAGVPVSINTDDPGVFAVTIEDELEHCRKDMGMTEEEIDRCMLVAYGARFTH